jgi:hypothetical protein
MTQQTMYVSFPEETSSKGRLCNNASSYAQADATTSPELLYLY